MRRTITGLTLAGCLAVTAPMQAVAQDRNSTAAIVAGLLTLGVIAAAVDARNDRERASAEDAARATDVTRAGTLGGSGSLGNGLWGRAVDRPHGRQARTLPQECRRDVRTDRGEQAAFSGPCLQRTYARARELPAQCARRVSTDRGVRTFYGAQCLKRAGYRVEARWDD